MADEIVILAHFYKAIAIGTLLNDAVLFVIEISVNLNDSGFALLHLAVCTEVIHTVGNGQTIRYGAVDFLISAYTQFSTVHGKVIITVILDQSGIHLNVAVFIDIIQGSVWNGNNPLLRYFA